MRATYTQYLNWHDTRGPTKGYRLFTLNSTTKKVLHSVDNDSSVRNGVDLIVGTEKLSREASRHAFRQVVHSDLYFVRLLKRHFQNFFSI
eukprot:scaffold45146_cov176-Amphora_coffeaeformis.AAC.1